MTLPAQLTALVGAGLIRQIQTHPTPEYIFRHVLVREAAYASLLKMDRRALHLATGETLEQLYPTTLDEWAPALAQHFAEAQEWARAWRYACRAGELALQRYANTEAVTHWQNAAQWLTESVATPADYEHVYLTLGRTLELTGQFPAALATYRDLEQWAQTHAAPAVELNALMAQTVLLCTPTVLHNPQQGEIHAQRALALARAHGNPAAEARAHWLFLLLYRMRRRMAEAQTHGEQAIALARELGLTEQLAFSLNDIAFVYLMTNQVARSRAVLAEARQIWEKLDNPHMLSDNLNASANVALASGDLTASLRLSTANLALAQRTANLWGEAQSQWLRATVLLAQGALAAGLAAAEASLTLSVQSGFTLGPQNLYRLLVETFGELGFAAQAEAMLQRWFAYGAQHPELNPLIWAAAAYWRARAGAVADAENWLTRARAHLRTEDLQTALVFRSAEAEVALAHATPAAALVMLEDMAARLRTQEFWFYLQPVLRRQAVALAHLGRVAEAIAALTEARTLALGMQNRLQLWLILQTYLWLAPPPGLTAWQTEFAALTTELRANLPADLAAHWPGAELLAASLPRAPH